VLTDDNFLDIRERWERANAAARRAVIASKPDIAIVYLLELLDRYRVAPFTPPISTTLLTETYLLASAASHLMSMPAESAHLFALAATPVERTGYHPSRAHASLAEFAETVGLAPRLEAVSALVATDSATALSGIIDLLYPGQEAAILMDLVTKGSTFELVHAANGDLRQGGFPRSLLFDAGLRLADSRRRVDKERAREVLLSYARLARRDSPWGRPSPADMANLETAFSALTRLRSELGPSAEHAGFLFTYASVLLETAPQIGPAVRLIEEAIWGAV